MSEAFEVVQEIIIFEPNNKMMQTYKSSIREYISQGNLATKSEVIPLHIDSVL